VAILLALISAIAYGVSDFLGGRAARRRPAVAVAFAAELVLLAVCLPAVPLIENEPPTTPAIVAGIIGGVSGSVAIVGLYRALSGGNMTIVAPVTGVVAAVVPVLFGVALGEQPGGIAWAGIALAIAAVGLIGGLGAAVGRRTRLPVRRQTVVLAIAVGVGFGVLFIAFARSGDSGLWPLLFARVGSFPVLALALAADPRARSGFRHRALVVPAVAVGGLIALANATYLISTRYGLLSIVAVVVSMYPASTIVLASVLDGERATRSQLVGMGLAAVALVMITLGA
jgi:drug/metabolite transporter (DMT)-like permease